MRTLSIPYVFGRLSHLIPLMVLHHNKIRALEKIDNRFLVESSISDMLSRFGMKSVPVHYRTSEIEQTQALQLQSVNKTILDTELKAIEDFKPDLLIEDFCFNSPMLSKRFNIPRISIQRTGMFSASIHERNPRHKHSLEKGMNQLVDVAPGHSMFDEIITEYAKSDAVIVPGIQSIECLPVGIKNSGPYFFSGPLTIPDRPSDKFAKAFATFRALNADKKIVFITTGLVDELKIRAYIELLLNKNYAVVTNERVGFEENAALFKWKLFPLNYLCSFVDLVIHQCGSGIYHYPIMHRKPSITLGTQCFDREEIALRLQTLNVSKHTPHHQDNEKHMSIFEGYLQEFEEDQLSDFDSIERLRNEIEQTTLEFDIKSVFDYCGVRYSQRSKKENSQV